MKNNILSRPYVGLTIALIILSLLFFPVFYTHYAYLDEIHQLWNNHDNSNYNMFFVQGRWLSGILFNKVFEDITLITQLKIIRIFTFFTWIFFLEEFFRIGKKWQVLINFEPLLLSLSGIYIACSISLAVYIGWGSCFEVGIATLLGLWSGHQFFEQLMKHMQGVNVSKFAIGLSILLGVCSLFMYQISFGIFLIPTVIYLIHKKSTANIRVLFLTIIAYIIITVIYYISFLLLLKIAAVPASARTNFSFDILGKLRFFFGIPLSHAFSFNFLYNSHSIVSQVFPILMMAFWVIFLFKTDKNSLGKKLVFLMLFIALCMLIYLPLLVGKESFSSYRTMFTLNLVVAFALLETAVQLIKKKSNKNIFSILIIFVFTVFACRNFRFNFIQPLKQEYQLVNNYLNKSYRPGIDTIYFLRPPENIFYTLYGITSFNDEFGIASTFKDWTPEPLVKQLIFEKTKDRTIAEKVTVIQFTEQHNYEEAIKNKRSNSIAFDMPFILKNTKE